MGSGPEENRRWAGLTAEGALPLSAITHLLEVMGPLICRPWANMRLLSNNRMPEVWCPAIAGKAFCHTAEQFCTAEIFLP